MLKAINLYMLTSVSVDRMSSYEKLLSCRNEEIKDHVEEKETVVELVNELIESGTNFREFGGFFYSYTIPQISKEFDLLKISKNLDTILNIELKSNTVSDEKIKKQLLRNRHYLKHVTQNVCSFCYVRTAEGGKIYRLDGDTLLESSMEEIKEANCAIGLDFLTEGIEAHFKPKEFLISPINSPEKFLEGDYFLTDQQDRIEERILGGIADDNRNIWGINGSAGTGKTLLLYDIAKKLSEHGRTCVIHSGILAQGHLELKSRSEFEILPIKDVNVETLSEYDFILIDESQRLYECAYLDIIDVHKQSNNMCIFAYDYYQTLSEGEQNTNIPGLLEQEGDFVENKLTGKIRTNKDVTSFIKNVLNLRDKPQKAMDYSMIDVVYADSMEDSDLIIKLYQTYGYKFISYTTSMYVKDSIDHYNGRVNSIDTHHVLGQEFDKVVIIMDNHFKYGENGRLKTMIHPNPNYLFYKLWYQAVSRAREKICIVVVDNYPLFDELVSIKNQQLYDCSVESLG